MLEKCSNQTMLTLDAIGWADSFKKINLSITFGERDKHFLCYLGGGNLLLGDSITRDLILLMATCPVDKADEQEPDEDTYLPHCTRPSGGDSWEEFAEAAGMPARYRITSNYYIPLHER